ncbi:MAG: hypothetical protein GKR93_11185 [Gammaproteobacteria bacterium]|nr:hypothetical protein [Gammaproteobacteria bacterium]
MMALLPEKFVSLNPFVESWALPNELQRSQQRWSASEEDYRRFYDAMMPMLDETLDYLDQYEIGNIPEEAIVLYHLSLAFAEAAPHVELYECANQVPNSFEAVRFEAAHGEQIDS